MPWNPTSSVGNRWQRRKPEQVSSDRRYRFQSGVCSLSSPRGLPNGDLVVANDRQRLVEPRTARRRRAMKRPGSPQRPALAAAAARGGGIRHAPVGGRDAAPRLVMPQARRGRHASPRSGGWARDQSLRRLNAPRGGTAAIELALRWDLDGLLGPRTPAGGRRQWAQQRARACWSSTWPSRRWSHRPAAIHQRRTAPPVLTPAQISQAAAALVRRPRRPAHPRPWFTTHRMLAPIPIHPCW